MPVRSMPVQFVLDRLFRRERLDRSMEEELRFHIAERAADLERSGVPIEEAERRAQLEFGGIESYKEQCRETRRFHGIHDFFADLRFGFRMLRRSPGFALLAILCLTLGIGANAAVFSWVEGILFRPYPAVAHQERLLALTGTARGEAGPTGLSWPDFLDLQRSCTLFDSFFVSQITGTTLYNVSPRDPVSFGTAFVVITIASLAACFLPAWRATRTDPLRALRD